MIQTTVIEEGKIGGDPPTHLLVEVRSEVLGDQVFWRGAAGDAGLIRNVPARRLAYQVAKDGIPRRYGMWRVSAVRKEEENC